MKDFVLERLGAAHERFGTAGFVLAVIALVVALAGGAYAAGGGLSGKQKKEVTKIAKQYAGKPGAPGPAGPSGQNGTNGTNGKDGAPGAPGQNGTNGKSVTVSNTAPGCPGGGATVKVEGAATGSEVCNGEEGEPGAIHPGETLPSEASETGTWAVTGEYPANGKVVAPISFPIPLSDAAAGVINEGAETLSAPNIHILAVGEDETEDCPGTLAAPEAAPGALCIYPELIEGFSEVAGHKLFVKVPGLLASGVVNSGAVVEGFAEAGLVAGTGTWAVTAP